MGSRPRMEHCRPTSTLRFNKELHCFWRRWIELAIDRTIYRYKEPVDRTVDRPADLATPNGFQTSVLMRISYPIWFLSILSLL